MLLFFILIAAIIGCALTTGIFVVSAVYNTPVHSQLFHDGDIVILLQEINFFTKNVKITEDTYYPGDIDHVIDLYEYDLNCDELPIEFSCQKEHSEMSNYLPNMTLYLVKGSNVELHVCASSNDTESDRIELVVTNDLERARNHQQETDKNVNFVFPIGLNGSPACETYSLSIENTNYYVLLFSISSLPIVFNYTFNIYKASVDLNSSPLPVSNCSLKRHNDNCLFEFEFSLLSVSCIVADVQQHSSRRYVHMTIEPTSSQGSVPTGIAASFVGTVLLLVVLITLVCIIKCCNKTTSYRVIE